MAARRRATAAAPAGEGPDAAAALSDVAAAAEMMRAAAEATCGTDARPMMTAEARRDVLLRLRKVNGQVAGITRMVEDDRYCVDVLQQLSAVTSAVEAVSKVVVRNYLERCVTDAINGGDPLIYDELMRVVFKHR
ncbi:MAG: metal-sensitive transcriptional regulator [Actinomycetota bacterium]|nr:metal-sensitive transcriptional regulator [Actinomycetota bacterium]